jgi:hypothetical protein
MRGGRRRLGTAAAAVLVAFLLAATVLAAGVTAEQLIAIAEQQFGMICSQVDPSHEHCATPSTSSDRWAADIEPASGLVTGLSTTASQYVAPMDQRAIAMMDGLHVPTCTDRAGVEAFVAKVAALTGDGTVGPDTIGTCVMRGQLAAGLRSYVYTVNASVLAPPTPTPTPTRTPAPRPTPTPSVSPTPTATLTPTPAGTATPSSSPSASAGPLDTASPTPSSSAFVGGAVESGQPSASPSSEGEVAAATGTPQPEGSLQPLRIPGLGFATSVRSLSAVRLDPAALGASALLALLLLLLMAFPGELFNSTVEANYDEIAGWFRRLRLPGIGAIWRGPLGVALLLVVGALVYSLLDPGFGLGQGSAASYVGLLVGLVIVLVTFELPGMLMHRRRTGEFGSLRALPWTLLAGGVCVAVSRLAGFEPGYLYGVLLGVVFRSPQPESDDGRQAAAGALWTLLTALAAWLALGWLRTNVTDAGFVRVAGETALAAVVVAGLEAVAFGLMPFRFLDGAAVRAWSRVVWAVLFGLGVFAFVHVLIGPQSGYLAEFAPSGIVAALAVFVGFGALSFAVWGYFRFRPARP